MDVKTFDDNIVSPPLYIIVPLIWKTTKKVTIIYDLNMTRTYNTSLIKSVNVVTK